MTLLVRGEIDLASAHGLERELRKAPSSARRIVVDLGGLEFIDSTGVHVLIDAQQRAENSGHELVLIHVPAQAQRLFTLTGLAARLSIE